MSPEKWKAEFQNLSSFLKPFLHRTEEKFGNVRELGRFI
jgi:hypothetical protein